MNRFVTSIRWLAVAFLALASLVGTTGLSAAAQSGNLDPASYESELSGIEIEISGDDFEIYDAEVQEYSHGQGEIVEIASNTAYVQIAFFDDTDTNEETLEIYNDAFSGDVDEFEVLDEGEDGDTVYTFAIATYEGVEFYYYLSVTTDVEDNVDLLQRIFATDATFFDDLADAQDAIEIDRDGFLESVDVADLEDLAGDGSRRDDEPTTEPEEEPTETAEAEPTEEVAEEPVPTIDPAGATVYEFQVIDAELVATTAVEVGQSDATLPAFEFLPMSLDGADVIIRLDRRPESPEASLDMMLSLLTPEGSSLQNIGSDATRTEAWSLDISEMNGEQYFVFIQVRSDLFPGFHYTQLLLTPVPDVVGTIEEVQQNIQVNGIPMFSGADLETLEWLLSGGEDPNAREEPVEGEQQQDEKTDVEGGEEEESGSLDLESQGLVSETEYESPQYGVPVEWDDSAWVVDLEWELTAVSDTETGVDSVILLWSSGDASMMVQILASDGAEPADYVDAWQSDEYVAESVHEDAEVLLADSGSRSGGVVYLTYDAEGNEYALAQEAIYIDDGVVAIVTIFSAPDAIADAYADAEDLVTVDGNDAAGTFTSREIERAIAP